LDRVSRVSRISRISRTSRISRGVREVFERVALNTREDARESQSVSLESLHLVHTNINIANRIRLQYFETWTCLFPPTCLQTWTRLDYRYFVDSPIIRWLALTIRWLAATHNKMILYIWFAYRGPARIGSCRSRDST
jgi:hypothetical protein